MDTFEIVRDVVFDDNPWIILRESDLEKLRESAKQCKDKAEKSALTEQIDAMAALRAEMGDKIQEVRITVKKPTPADRVAIRAACRRDGEMQPDREPLQACAHLVQSWSLGYEVTLENIEQKLPIAILDLIYADVFKYLYPSQARLAFLPQSLGL